MPMAKKRAREPVSERRRRSSERLGAGLAGGRSAVADVDDGGLLLAVEASERGLEHRAEIGGAAHRVIAELLERLGDVALRGRREAVLRVDDGGRDVEGHEREVILIAERAESALGGGHAELTRALVAAGGGVDDEHDVGVGLRLLREVLVGRVAQHDVVGLIGAGLEAPCRDGRTLLLAGELELEVGARDVAAATHRDGSTAGLDAGVERATRHRRPGRCRRRRRRARTRRSAPGRRNGEDTRIASCPRPWAASRCSGARRDACRSRGSGRCARGRCGRRPTRGARGRCPGASRRRTAPPPRASR